MTTVVIILAGACLANSINAAILHRRITKLERRRGDE